MFKFPESLYTDVRIEAVFETRVVYTLGNLNESESPEIQSSIHTDI